MFRTVISLIVISSVLVLTACSGARDPIDQPGTWSLHNDNDANLLSMLANPAELERGTGSDMARDVGRGAQSSAAVERLLTDKTRPLAAIANFSVGGRDAGGH